MSFSIDLKSYAKQTGENLDALTREVVQELGARIVKRSPVGRPQGWADWNKGGASANKEHWLVKTGWVGDGYVGGRFRANWQYGFNAIPTGELFSEDDKSFPSAEETIDRIKPTATDGIHYIVNNLPYAQRLENGYSKQAPAGMVGLAVTGFQSILSERAAKI